MSEHRTKFWWACPVCLEARTRDADEWVREWATKQLNYLKWAKREYNDEMNRLKREENQHDQRKPH